MLLLRRDVAGGDSPGCDAQVLPIAAAGEGFPGAAADQPDPAGVGQHRDHGGQFLAGAGQPDLHDLRAAGPGHQSPATYGGTRTAGREK